jgi:tight adherence protein C
MVVCVEAGMGLDAAVTRVGEEIRLSSPGVSEEFRLLSLELRAGKMRQDALRALAMRTGLEEFTSFSSLLIQTDRFGTSVAQALRVHAEALRIKRALRAEEMAAKLPVKLVLPLVLFIFPSIFVVVLGPAAIRIYRSFVQSFMQQ